MKVVALIGSSRDGNTKSMVTAAASALQGKADVEVIHLGAESRPGFCDGCLSCDETGQCHIQDDMQASLAKIASADGLIIGSPARWNLLSGELKTFFDRLNPFAVSEGLKGKKAVVLVVGQSSEEHGESIIHAKDSVVRFCDSAGIEVIDSVLAFDCLECGDIQEKFPQKLEACQKAAQNLYNAVKNHGCTRTGT